MKHPELNEIKKLHWDLQVDLNKQKEIQILIGDLERETKQLNSFLVAQTKRIQNIKDRIDYQIQLFNKKHSLNTTYSND